MRSLVAIVAIACLGGCSDTTYTLYRGSVTGPMRIHVATFDTVNPGEYNRENCEIAARLFQGQPGVKVRYWCEKGQFRA
jgi:hypothetical protein